MVPASFCAAGPPHPLSLEGVSELRAELKPRPLPGALVALGKLVPWLLNKGCASV
jgi:hypothetical protein